MEKFKGFGNINDWLNAKWLNMELNDLGYYGFIPTLKLYKQINSI